MKAASAPATDYLSVRGQVSKGTMCGRLRDSGSPASSVGLWCDQGKRTEARDLLAPIYGWFTEGSDTPVLQEARALLDELA